MNTEKLRQYWYPILPISDIKNKPIATMLLDTPLVIARLSGEIVCFFDLCPHRHIPLSHGKNTGTHLQCCYHGWRFDKDGLVSIPTQIETTEPLAINQPCTQNCTHIKKYPTRIHEDWLWVSLSDNEFKPASSFSCPDGFDTTDKVRPLQGDFIHSIENFLDATHTPYVHKGLLRNQGTQRTHFSQTHDDNSFATTYRLIDKQNGLINRLFDAGIDVNVAGFELPCVAYIDYLKGDKLYYRITLAFIPKTKGQMQLSAKVSIIKDKLPKALKFTIINAFLTALLIQDQRTLKIHHANKRRDMPYVICHHDLVIDHLLYLLADKAESVDKSGVMSL